MRTFSRWMPPTPTLRGTPGVKAVMGALGAGALALLVAYPVAVLTGAAVLAPVIVLGDARRERRMRRLAEARPGEGICTFVRGFDRRAVDPWVLRAVWDEIQGSCGFRGGTLPVRAADRLREELDLDGDLLDEVAEDVAARARRSLRGSERNPLYGRVRTVGDLVRFLCHQPKEDAA